jgi:hypothetical protein
VTLKVEGSADGQTTILRVIGRGRSEHLEEVRAQIEDVPILICRAELVLHNRSNQQVAG